ncbi:hypothetical protein [Cerasicoccus maritimus]|uniref:hypothetical protein n=1 Tax=Cerasicoccus maritimus TaxID=490089 RepID=UPI00285280D3|nr:hypothetical protein [Cerasicoccus maritimus]
MIFFHTLPVGQQAAVWRPDGNYDIETGPQRIFAFNRRIQYLQPFTAHPNEYIRVQFKNGDTRHIRGPAVEFLDPIVHETIEVREAIEIDGGEALVTYNEADDGGVIRRIVRGPALHFPQANEWVHDFRWHGSDGFEHDKKRPGALTFQKLRTAPDQMYYRVEAVRTRDEAVLDVRLMLFFELVDIERMLDVTHDPIADFINALTADIMDFVADKTFEQFKANTKLLNALEGYPQLIKRAERMGYQVNKVAYRGYLANPKLQAMHDNAIETRTRLALEAETETQKQAVADLQQARQLEREARMRNEADNAAEHQRRLQRAAADQERELKQLEHTRALRQHAEELETERNHQQAMNELEAGRDDAQHATRLKLYQGMQAAGVDLTQVLVAEHQRTPDKLIRIDGDAKTRVHLDAI